MLSQNMTDKIIDYIMSHGGDFAEVFAEHTRRNQLAMIRWKYVRGTGRN